jgi:hypothetical protein
MKKLRTVLGLILMYLGAWVHGMKYCLLPFFIVLVTMQANGQSVPLKREYAKKPITDTCYLYVYKTFTNSDGKTIIWQEDLQTGDRYETILDCTPAVIIKKDTILRTLRTQMFIEPKTKRRRNA